MLHAIENVIENAQEVKFCDKKQQLQASIIVENSHIMSDQPQNRQLELNRVELWRTSFQKIKECLWPKAILEGQPSI